MENYDKKEQESERELIGLLNSEYFDRRVMCRVHDSISMTNRLIEIAVQLLSLLLLFKM